MYLLSFFIAVCLLSCFNNSLAQSFSKISYEEALTKSKQSGKLLFILFESDECKQCNEVADKAFENKDFIKQLDETFISLKISANHPDRKRIAESFNKQQQGNFGVLFVNGNGTLIHTYPGSSSMPKHYQEHIDKALQKAGEGIKLNELESAYNAGNTSPGLVELLLTTKKSLNLDTEVLLDQYVKSLPADSLNSIRTIQFITSMAPILGSDADRAIKKNKELFSQSWKLMDQNTRVNVNQRVGYKSLQKAIKEKNLEYATRVSWFRAGTYSSQEAGTKARLSTLMEYYLGVDDTSRYIIVASDFYDRYFMSISVDSIKRNDSIRLKELFNKQKPPETVTGQVVRQSVGFVPSTQYYNRQLNEAALNFYKLSGSPAHLQKALTWSARANEFFDDPISMNTHARILYKLGKTTEAEEWQKKAILLKKTRGFDVKSLEEELEQMKKGNF